VRTTEHPVAGVPADTTKLTTYNDNDRIQTMDEIIADLLDDMAELETTEPDLGETIFILERIVGAASTALSILNGKA